MAEVEEVVFPYLQSKFSSILLEAEADPNCPSRIISRFRSIERFINSKCETIGPSPYLVNHLYDLIDELSECRILSHQSRNAVVSRKGLFRVLPLSDFLFTRRMKNRLDDIERQLKNEADAQQTRPIPAKSVLIQQTYPAMDASGIIGFESHTNRIEKFLINNLFHTEEEEEFEGITTIGIVGRSGCGKTALAQKVFASPEIQDNFSPRIWVSLSNTLFDKEKRADTRVRVLSYILEEIGHDVSESEEYADIGVIKLLEKLQRALMGKRYLIVLDDVWRVDEWYSDLGYCLPRGHATGELFSHGLPRGSGGGVIVTSRLENVVRRVVGEKHVIRMESHLSDDICWEIFSHVVGEMEVVERHTLTEMKKDIIRNCDGLPLAARTLANVIPPLLLEKA